MCREDKCSLHSLPVTNLAPSSSMIFNHSLLGSVPTTTVQPAVSMASGRGLCCVPITHSSPKGTPVSCSLSVVTFLSSDPLLGVCKPACAHVHMHIIIILSYAELY